MKPKSIDVRHHGRGVQVPAILCGLAFTIFSCHPTQPKAPLTSEVASPDSLKITLTAHNLSEDLTGNDEVLIFLYRDKDTLSLDSPIFENRFTMPAKGSSRVLKFRIGEDISNATLIMFLLEQDADWPIRKIDSTLRASHRAIEKEFVRRNYTGMEAYLGDEDVIGIKRIPPLQCAGRYNANFAGIYKLDRYEYEVSMECLN